MLGVCRRNFITPLIVLSFVAAAVADCSSATGPLSKWLCVITFQLPDFTFVVDDFHIAMGNTTCTQLEVGKITSDVSLARDDHRPALALDAEGISFSCHIERLDVQHKTIWPLGPIKAIGSASFGVSSTEIKTQVLLKMQGGLAVASDLSDDTSLTIGDLQLHLEGNVWVKIASLFEGALHNYLKDKLLPTELVKTMKSVVHNNGTQALGVLDQWVLSLPFPALPEPAKLPADTVDWRQSDGLKVFDYVVNDVIGAVGPFGLDAMVDALTDSSGAVSVQLSSFVPPIELAVPGLATVAVHLGVMNISGLDEVSVLDVFTPNSSASEAHTLRSRLAISHINASMDVRLNVTPAGETLKGYSLVEDFRISVDFRDATAEASLLLAVNKTAAHDLVLSTLLQPGCLARLVQPEGLKLRQLGLRTQLDSILIAARGGGLEFGVDTLLDNALLLMTESFASVIPTAVDGVFGGPLRDLIDSSLQDALHSLRSSPCVPAPPVPAPPPVPPRSPDLIDWRDSEVLGIVDYLVDDVVGANGPLGLDTLVDALTGDTGVLSVNLSSLIPTATLHVPGVATIGVDIGQLWLSGLDRLRGVHLLYADPKDPFGLLSGARLDALNASLSLSVTVTPFVSHKQPTLLPLTLRASLDKVAFSAALRLAVNGSGLAGLQPPQFLSGSCLARETLVAALSSFAIEGVLTSLSVADGSVTASLPLELHPHLPPTFKAWAIREANEFVAATLARLRTSGCETPSPEPAPPVPASSPDLIDWRDSEALTLVDYLVDDVVGAEGPLGLDTLVDALTGGTGVLSVNMSALIPTATLPVPGIATIGVDISQLRLYGLDRLRGVHLLAADPKDPFGLLSGARLDKLNASLSLSVTLTPFDRQQQPTLLPLTLSVSLDGLAVNAALRLAVNGSGLAGLQPPQYLSGACLGHEVLFGAISSLALEGALTSLRVTDGSVSSSMPVARALRVPLSVEHWLKLEASAWMSSTLKSLRSSSCPPAPVPPQMPVPQPSPDFVDWRGNEAVSALTFITDDVIPAVGGLNTIVDAVTGGTGSLFLNLSTIVPGVKLSVPGIASVELDVAQVSLSGLDQLKDVHLLSADAEDPFGLLSGVHVDLLNASLWVNLSVSSCDGCAATTLPLTLSASVSAAALSTGFRVAVNGSGLSALQLRQVLHSPCLAQELVLAMVSSLHAAGNVRYLSVSAGTISARLPQPLSLRIPASVEQWLLDTLNSYIAGLLVGWQKGECVPPSWPAPSMVDMRTSAAVRDAARYANGLGSAGVNKLEDRLSNIVGMPKGVLRLPEQLDLFSLSIVDDLVGPLLLRVAEFGLSGLDTAFDFRLFQTDASEPYALRHTVGLGGNRSLRASTKLVIGLDERAHAFHVEIGARDLMLQLGTSLQLDGAELGSMPLSSAVFNPVSLLCPVHHVSLTSESKVFLDAPRGGKVQLRATSVREGTSALLASSGALRSLDVLQPGALRMINNAIHTKLAELRAPCNTPPPPPPPFSPPPPASVLTVGVPLVSSTVFILLGAILLGIWGCIRRWRWHASLRRGLLDNDSLPHPEAMAIDMPEPSKLWEPASDSLSSCPEFRHPVVQICVPLLLLVTCGCFVVANIYPGAAVHVFLTVAGEEVQLPAIFEFTLISSVTNMWQGEAYFLSVLIALLSGVWPYAKLLLMLLAWWAPGSLLSPFYRERFLRGLDALGKWSLIDFLMLMMMMVTFSTEIDIPSSDTDTSQFAHVQVEVLPGFGILAFLTAASLSLVASHVLLAMQRLATAKSRLQDESVPHGPTAQPPDCAALANQTAPSAISRTPLRCHRFRRLIFMTDWKLSLPCQAAVVLLLVACISVMCAAFVIDSFAIHIVGLAGAILPTDVADKSFSLVHMASSVTSVSPHASPSIMLFLQIVFFLLCVATPLAWLVSLVALWLVPMSRTVRSRLVAAAEILHAWAAIDVFILMVIASLLELNRFAHFLVGSECDAVDSVLRDHFSDLIPDAAEGCFGINLSIEFGFVVLFAASFLCMSTGHFVMYAANTALEQDAA